MSIKIPLGLLAITGVLLSTEVTYAWVSHSGDRVRVVNNTPSIPASDGDNLTNSENVNYNTDRIENNRSSVSNNIDSSNTNIVDKSSATRRKNTLDRAHLGARIDRDPVLAARNSQELKFENNNSTVSDLAPANPEAANVLTQQKDVFSSDVAVLGGRTEIKSSPAVEPAEASVVILVPPPLTQFIKKVQPVATLRPVTKLRKLPTVVAIPTVQPGATPIVVDNATADIDPTATVPGQVAIYPLLNPAPVTSRFGWRTHPLTGTRRFHSGVDIGAPMGAPVVATVSGTIVSAGWNGGYGKAIVIQHGTQQTLYGHLSEISVQAGQSIDQGTVIGSVGSTGNSTGPHLHFESRISTDKGWVAVDPGDEIKYALDVLKRSDPYARKDLPAGI